MCTTAMSIKNSTTNRTTCEYLKSGLTFKCIPDRISHLLPGVADFIPSVKNVGTLTIASNKIQDQVHPLDVTNNKLTPEKKEAMALKHNHQSSTLSLASWSCIGKEKSMSHIPLGGTELNESA